MIQRRLAADGGGRRRPVPAAAIWLAAALMHRAAIACTDAVPEVGPLQFTGAPAKPPAPRLGESERMGLPTLPAPVLRMPPLDSEFLLAEDERQPLLPGERVPLRVAIAQPVLLECAHGEWLRIDAGDARGEGGWLWRVDLDADAPSAKLHVSGLELAEGERLTLSSPDWPDSAIGPLVGRGWFDNGEAWGAFTPTSRVRIEWFVPGARGGARLPERLPFKGVEYYQAYRDVYAGLRPAGDGSEAGSEAGSEGGVAGNCHFTPSCFGWTADPSDGTAKLIFASGGSVYTCTGQTVNNYAADYTPYVATAFHCIATESEAQSCDFLFRNRWDDCNGQYSPGLMASASTLVKKYPAADSTLLRVFQALPEGTYFYGWTAASVPAGTTSFCIHHPSGAPQALSRGTKLSSGYNCGPPIGVPSAPSWNWNHIDWFSGITEPGSSGSAICRQGDKYLYGVLTCGTSGCDDFSGTEGFGRWDVAYGPGGFSAPLQGGSDDPFEPNDACASARSVGDLNASGLVVKKNDEDHFRFLCLPGQRVRITANFTHSFGDIDLQLLAGCDGGVLSSSSSVGGTEVIDIFNPSGTAQLRLRVFLASGQRNTYALSIDVPGVDVDLDNDGEVSGGDLTILLVSWGSGAGSAADLNGDGVVGATDLALLLSAWG